MSTENEEFEKLVTLLIQTFGKPAPNTPHQHRCGYGADGLPGCGHVWDHTGGSHTCPVCGEGPWTWRWDPMAPDILDFELRTGVRMVLR